MTPRFLSTIPSLQFPAFPSTQANQQLALQFQLEQSQWETPTSIEALQLRQLQLVVRHAAETSPYYSQLFASKGLRLPTVIDFAFLRTLPISRRSDLQQAGERLTSTRPLKEHGPTQFATTSGSTGRPLRFGRTLATHLNWLAFALRDHLWHRRDFTGKLCTLRFAPPGVAEAPAGESNPNWGAIVAPIFACGPAARLNVSTPPSGQLEWLHREKPDYLISFPSNLLALADYAAKNGIALPAIRELRTVGEMLPRESRKRLAETWQAKITDLYSCEESGYLALQCPQHDHYHVQSENVWLEIVDESGAPCPVGVPGRVVITSLNNFATPLIRYDIGDYAEFGPPCPCGRGLPVIREIFGRSRNRIRLPDGTNRFPRIGEAAIIEGVPGLKVSQFKCIQHSLEKIEFQIVADRSLTPEEQTALATKLQKNLGHPFEITLSFPSEIPRNPNGKMEVFVCLLPD